MDMEKKGCSALRISLIKRISFGFGPFSVRLGRPLPCITGEIRFVRKIHQYNNGKQQDKCQHANNWLLTFTSISLLLSTQSGRTIKLLQLFSCHALWLKWSVCVCVCADEENLAKTTVIVISINDNSAEGKMGKLRKQQSH